MISVGRVLWALLKTISSVKLHEFKCPSQKIKGKAIEQRLDWSHLCGDRTLFRGTEGGPDPWSWSLTCRPWLGSCMDYQSMEAIRAVKCLGALRPA